MEYIIQSYVEVLYSNIIKLSWLSVIFHYYQIIMVKCYIPLLSNYHG